MKYSTVIATHNRIYCVEEAINSALNEFPNGEVVVVDDASTDGTTRHIFWRYAAEIEAGRLVAICAEKNLGVTAAKNLGYTHARGDWVIFLDSDDVYSPDAGRAMEADMDHYSHVPIIFFRCIDEQGRFVGNLQHERRYLDLTTYVMHTSFGEALTAINKRKVGSSPPYVAELRGYEGLGCARLIAHHGHALLSDVVGRVYVTQGDDRLSSMRAMLNRMPLLAKGHLMMVREFGRNMSVTRMTGLFLRSILYYVLGQIIKFHFQGKK